MCSYFEGTRLGLYKHSSNGLRVCSLPAQSFFFFLSRGLGRKDVKGDHPSESSLSYFSSVGFSAFESFKETEQIRLVVFYHVVANFHHGRALNEVMPHLECGAALTPPDTAPWDFRETGQRERNAAGLQGSCSCRCDCPQQLLRTVKQDKKKLPNVVCKEDV